MANLSAIVTARHARLGEDFLDGTYYVSEQAHASADQGRPDRRLLASRDVRIVPTDEQPADGPRSLAHDGPRGPRGRDRPFLVVPSVGHDEHRRRRSHRAPIADVAAEEGLWMHVDGAYGGFFMLTERGRGWFRGVERATP